MHLTTLGFRRGNVHDVTAFQRGWNLGPALVVDGIVGPKTRAAMKISLDRGDNGRPDASEHFWWREFACSCNRSTCGGIRVERQLLAGLERLRAVGYPAGLQIISGYRCREHNAAVGGSEASQHLHGAAADIVPRVPGPQVAGLRVFSGIGTDVTTSGPTRHVDVRHAAGHNLTGGTVTNPTRWSY